MPPADSGPTVAPARILVSAETLFGEYAGAPRPLEVTAAAIERLGWIGGPVVIIGDHVAGRRLPDDPDDRIAWIRSSLGAPDLAAVVFDAPVVSRASGAAERAAIASWSLLGDRWHADRLVTGGNTSVGPARRAGLTVVRIGPRDQVRDPPLERPDHEARDLLDAVRRLMTAAAFVGAPGR